MTLFEEQHFKREISKTLIAKYKGDFSYEVLTSNQGEEGRNFLVPSLHMYDYFAEINFVYPTQTLEKPEP